MQLGNDEDTRFVDSSSNSRSHFNTLMGNSHIMFPNLICFFVNFMLTFKSKDRSIQFYKRL